MMTKLVNDGKKKDSIAVEKGVGFVGTNQYNISNSFLHNIE